MIEQKINVKIPDKLEAQFANMIQIAHKDDEFCLTFIHGAPTLPLKTAKAIISITPSHAKRLLKELKLNIQKYEKKYGEIKLAEEPEKPSNEEIA